MLNDFDDEEDLRIFADDDIGIFGNPYQDKLYDVIIRHINSLKYADLSKRVDSLVSLNDLISNMTEESQPVLLRSANDLITAFIHVIVDIFDKSAGEINLRFAKYFISIVLKTCQCKEIMMQVC